MRIASILNRVSTKDQKDSGSSLETQLEQCLKKAAELGLEVPNEFIIQEDWTGTDLQRPNILTLLRWARSGSIQAIII